MSGVAKAERDLHAARQRLQATLGELGHRVSPRTIAQGAWDETRERAVDLAEGAIDTVKARPAATGLVAAGIVALLARNRIASAVGTLLHRGTAASDHKGESK